MDRTIYLAEVNKRLMAIYSASKEGYRIPAVDRHRLEGFMQAGVFLGLAKNNELSELMDKLHIQVFGKSIEARKQEKASTWKNDSIDYSQYEPPTYTRK